MTDQTTIAETDTKTGIVLPSEQEAPTLRADIARMEHQFALAAPRGVEARQIVRDALTAVSKSPDLLKCTPNSVLGGLMTMAQLGLRVGVLGHGWILPFWNARAKWTDDNGRERSGAFEAQLVIGYQGLIELAYRSGQIARITAHTVHENDHFDVAYGLEENLTHRPATSNRGAAVGYYATVAIKGGASSFYYLTREEAEAYRDRYAMAKTKAGAIVGPWKSEFDAMAKKTCVRQLSKFMPKGTELAVAIAADDTVRVDIDPRADISHVSHHVEAVMAQATPHVDEVDPPDAQEPTDA